MRWPDLFFKSRKPRTVPEIATVPAKTSEASEASKTAAPARTETAKVGAAMSERDKTESLRALTETDNDTSPPAADPAATRPVDGRPAPGLDSSNAKTAALPPLTRPHTLSLRQRAKLTDDALSAPKKDEESASTQNASVSKTDRETDAAKASASTLPEEKASAPAAVVPAAFTVPVETGTIMESSAEKLAEKTSDKPSAEPEAAKASSMLPETRDVPSSPEKSDAAAGLPKTETARVHLAPATTSEPPSTASTAIAAAKPAGVDTREKQEFVLANGERILGHVLSETPQTIYLDHSTLGVLTLPRSQVAAKPIEVILINGDRIVGDLIAETPECLYIKHASLGMLTVPHSQRSARVVEAILKDGDRILGEVLAETENFTVIRSATLGTVAVQHEQVAMLNRKIEQMQLRTLPNPALALEDKKS
jgi:RNase P/RNase MRP subunit p29